MRLAGVLQGTYSRRLVVCVADSTQQMFVTACGEAEEPQLHFCPDVLDLGACLPASIEAEAEVTVKNPCSFPVEFYSLELDKQYLEEEKVVFCPQYVSQVTSVEVMDFSLSTIYSMSLLKHPF